MKTPSIQLLQALRNSLSPRQFHPYRIPCQASRWRTGSSRLLTTSVACMNRHAPSPSRSRGPKSSEDTQTHFPAMDVLGDMPPPTSAIDACTDDGFHLNSGVKITEGSGMILAGGEAFAWRPWAGTKAGRAGMLNEKGQWDVADDSWGILDLMWPKPDLLILGLGASTYPISPATRRRINQLGIRVDIQDTRNAAAQFNLLATERGVSTIAAAFIPTGWRGKA